MTQIVVRAPNWIGDQIMAYPFFHYLRKEFAGARIVSVCVPWVADLQFQDLVDDVFVLETKKNASIFEKFLKLNSEASRFARQYPEGFDYGFSLPNSFSAAWFLKRGGVRMRRGYRFEGRGFLLNDGLDWEDNPNIHRSQSYVNLLPKSETLPPIREFWGLVDDDQIDRPITGESVVFRPKNAWPLADPLKPPERDYYVMAPGSRAPARQWSRAQYLELAEQIFEKTGWTCAIVGSKDEGPLAQWFCGTTGSKRAQFVDYTGQGSVVDLWKLFSGAKFTICNESGLAHVASLCGSSVQIVCGAADPRRTQPLGPGKVHVKTNPIDCWPCERNVCQREELDKNACLRGIDADSVWREIQTIL